MVQSRSRTAGFSLIELLVAMTITLVISGAIYGLMAAGQSSFSREPELTDRQQNIRVAMSLIEQDIANAGSQLPDLFQSFSPTEPDLVTLLDGRGPASPRLLTQADGATVATNSDFLQIFGNEGQCSELTACGAPGVNFFTQQATPGCFSVPGIVMARSTAPNAAGQLLWACVPGGGGGAGCGAVGNHFNFPPGKGAPGMNPPGGPDPAYNTLSAVQVVRYEIRLDAVEKDRNGNFIPGLWRSANAGGIFGGAGAGCVDPLGANSWQLVARWIEDLQVQYRTNNGWFNSPPAAGATAFTLTSYNDIVREVRFTLSARANLSGTSPGAGGAGGIATRGQLTTTASPRAVLEALTHANPPQWR